MKIVRLANFVTPRSGGLRTALRELGAGYVQAGHVTELVVPGERDGVAESEQGRVTTVAGPLVPGSGGYRVILGRARLLRTLDELAPDRLEVSDRTTLRWTGAALRRTAGCSGRPPAGVGSDRSRPVAVVPGRLARDRGNGVAGPALP